MTEPSSAPVGKVQQIVRCDHPLHVNLYGNKRRGPRCQPKTTPATSAPSPAVPEDR